jgi:hypothetical protein
MQDLQAVAQENAARGAAYLDQEHFDWFQQINIKDLNLGCPSFCIVGQLFGSYYNFAKTKSWTWLSDHGFAHLEELGHNCLQSEWTELSKEYMTALKNAWTYEISRRENAEKYLDLVEELCYNETY